MADLKMMLQNLRDKSKCCKKDDFTGERYTIIHDMSIETLNMICEDGLEQLENAQTVNRWISCSERMPEDFAWCLVCMSDGCIRLGKWNGEYDEQGVWWVSHPNSGGKLYRIKNVPFWMPLPEPPEGGAEA